MEEAGGEADQCCLCGIMPYRHPSDRIIHASGPSQVRKLIQLCAGCIRLLAELYVFFFVTTSFEQSTWFNFAVRLFSLRCILDKAVGILL